MIYGAYQFVCIASFQGWYCIAWIFCSDWRLERWIIETVIAFLFKEWERSNHLTNTWIPFNQGLVCRHVPLPKDERNETIRNLNVGIACTSAMKKMKNCQLPCKYVLMRSAANVRIFYFAASRSFICFWRRRKYTDGTRTDFIVTYTYYGILHTYFYSHMFLACGRGIRQNHTSTF